MRAALEEKVDRGPPPADGRGLSAMAMPAADIEAMIKAALPDAEVEINDLAGDGDHYAARVTSAAFAGKNRVAAAQAGLRGARRADGRRAPRLATDHRRSQLNANTAIPVPRPVPMSDTNARISQIVNTQRRRAVHEGHAAVPAMRLLEPRDRDPRPSRRRLRQRRRAAGHGDPLRASRPSPTGRPSRSSM